MQLRWDKVGRQSLWLSRLPKSGPRSQEPMPPTASGNILDWKILKLFPLFCDPQASIPNTIYCLEYSQEEFRRIYCGVHSLFSGRTLDWAKSRGKCWRVNLSSAETEVLVEAVATYGTWGRRTQTSWANSSKRTALFNQFQARLFNSVESDSGEVDWGN